MSFGIASEVLLAEGTRQYQIQNKEYKGSETKDGEMKRVNTQGARWSSTSTITCTLTIITIAHGIAVAVVLTAYALPFLVAKTVKVVDLSGQQHPFELELPSTMMCCAVCENLDNTTWRVLLATQR
jgi:hypothetical protein